MILGGLDRLLERLGDRMNPILVKETRQALKSRQFSSTFMLLLVASLVVSFGGVALSGPNIDYKTTGVAFFVSYFAVLAFAIFVVVPFGAYRSLAAEQEERTYELLSITTLRPGQIVLGKLLTAMIQMFIYYSAIAPFMAFTYLLKGIDVPAIFFVLFWAVLASAGFSMLGLLLATFSSRRTWQVLLSVVMIIGLSFATILSVPVSYGTVISIGGQTRDPLLWIAMAALLTSYVTLFALAFQLSVSQLTFEADNRSSKVRIALTIQFLAGLAWSGWTWAMQSQGQKEILEIFAALGCSYWAVVGAFLIAEPVGFSRRVARQVPRTGILRWLTTLFFPGPGTGLAFFLVHLVSIVLLVTVAELTEVWVVVNWRPTRTFLEPTAMTIAMAAYSFIYVGLGAFLVRLIRRFRTLPAIGGAAITAILAAAGSLVPNFFVMAFRPMGYKVFELWQVFDPIATVIEIYDHPAIISELVLIPVGMAGFVFLLNLRPMVLAVMEIHAAGSLPAPANRETQSAQPEAPADVLAAAVESAAGV